MSMLVGIIDYGMGNLSSVANAFEALGVPSRILSEPDSLPEVSHVILPGVGAFGDGIRNLAERGWVEAMHATVVEGGKPFLGICLGMQLLAELGTEHGQHKGLGWIPGSVIRLSDNGGTIRVPHIGWNDANPARHDGCYVADFQKPGVFYFVHSFFLSPTDPSVVDGWCEYGGQTFAASVSLRNIWAVQYHPEKSQKAGLSVLKNFVNHCSPLSETNKQ